MRIQDLAYSRGRPTFMGKMLRWVAWLFVKIVGVKCLNAWRNRMNYRRPFASSERCTSLYCMRGYTELNCRTNAFKDAVEVPFEYTTISAPSGYEEVLENLYGDWHVCIKGAADHSYQDLELDIPYKEFVKEKYNWTP